MMASGMTNGTNRSKRIGETIGTFAVTKCTIESRWNMKAVDIKWDTDGDMDLFQALPTEVEIPEEIIEEDEISDYLSDMTGFCHVGFRLEKRLDKPIRLC